ncbi:SigB/SigF/SigG family RNA polymerase sigma factor [Longispora fulva]|uniref:RNA polymerase sigma-B factor n=1 Tax=Longispora fulva TaxID=619741 RepID=A0A8J7KVE1_9ACTN|nr:SigB/SigF/SigG family RNA polymerase sigma factor [Longispora fulva]MBG6135197.1 RNA polymerase sigma-B factor [Longispora fulva]
MSTTALTTRPAEDRISAALDHLHALPADHPDRAALRERAISAALPVADRIAHRFAHRGEALEDLVQVARVALVRCVDGYDPARGPGFTAYAVPCIAGELKRHFRDRAWSVRVPRRLQETRLELNQAVALLGQRLGRTPTVTDLAGYLGITEEDVRAGQDCAAAYTAVSLQAPVDSGAELGDLLGAEDHALDVVETRESLRPLLARLSGRERRILALRYGEDLTQSEIADRVALSQMHVSRLLRGALDQLHTWMETSGDA